jgi:hypothetical protein
MKRFILAFLLLTSGAQAQVFSAPPVTLVNGQTANATDVMANLNAIINSGNASFNAIQTLITNYVPTSVPSGMIAGFAVCCCPAGWQNADGTSGSPDLRGNFIRVWNSSGSGFDSGRSLGTLQLDSLQQHQHSGSYGPFYTGVTTITLHITTTGATQGFLSGTTPYTSTGGIGGVTVGANGAETRPANYSILYCMKS